MYVELQYAFRVSFSANLTRTCPNHWGTSDRMIPVGTFQSVDLVQGHLCFMRGSNIFNVLEVKHGEHYDVDLV